MMSLLLTTKHAQAFGACGPFSSPVFQVRPGAVVLGSGAQASVGTLVRAALSCRSHTRYSRRPVRMVPRRPGSIPGRACSGRGRRGDLHGRGYLVALETLALAAAAVSDSARRAFEDAKVVGPLLQRRYYLLFRKV